MNKDKFEKYRLIGQSIAYYRERRGLSRKELAIRIHVQEEWLRDMETFCPNITALIKPPWTGKSMDILFALSANLELDVIAFFLPANEENFEKYRIDK